MTQPIVRFAALVSCGAAISFLGFCVYPFAVGEPLRSIGIPPADWFGSDYVDPRGSAVAFSGEVFFLGLLYCGIGRRFEPLTRLQAFSMTSPFSLLLGYVGLRFFRPDHLAFEYDQAAFWTVLVGWPILWHLAVLGARQASWRRATCIAVAYSLSLFSLVIVQAYRVYAF